MPKTPRSKIPVSDSTERPFTVSLSAAEVLAIVNYHTAQVRRIPKILGNAALKLQASSILWSSRDMRALHAEAKLQVESHTNRARGLLSILKQ